MKSNDPASWESAQQQPPQLGLWGNSHLTMTESSRVPIEDQTCCHALAARCSKLWGICSILSYMSHIYTFSHLADFSRISCRPVAKHSRSSTPCSWQQLSAPLDATARCFKGPWFVLILGFSAPCHHDSRILSAAGCSAPWEFLHGTLVVSSWEKWQEV